MLSQRLLAVKQQQDDGPKSLYQIISDLGLTSSLKLCLDAGDAASYDPAVQTDKWLDTSGNGCDFFRGTGAGSDAADPTFNGTAGGLSSAEYWSFDSGDYFKYDSTNESWMNNLHKRNAKLSVVAVVWLPNLGVQQAIIGNIVLATDIGIRVQVSSSETFQLVNYYGPTADFVMRSSQTVTPLAWNVLGMSYDDAAPQGYIHINSSVEAFSAPYHSPSSSDAIYTLDVAAGGNGQRRFGSAARLACLAIWEGTALTSQNLTDIYDAIKGRFGL